MRAVNLSIIRYTINVSIYIVFSGVAVFLLLKSPTRKASFVCRDSAISAAVLEELVPVSALIAVCLLPLIAVVVVAEVLNSVLGGRGTRQTSFCCFKCRDDIIRVLHPLAAYLFGFCFSTGLVELLKVVNPQPRPTFLEWCKPNVKDNCTAGKLINEYECTNSELSSSLALSQIHTSFPSGHAAAAAYSMTYLMCFIQVRLFADCRDLSHVLGIIKPTTQMGALTAALLIAVSRVADHSHHLVDVAAGLLIGVIVSLLIVFTVADRFLGPEEQLGEQNIAAGPGLPEAEDNDVNHFHTSTA